MKIRSYTVEEFIKKVEAFHGYAAPGVVLGGFMVELAYRHLPAEGLFDAIVETPKCLPDAIQLLTPCTLGNSWLRIIDSGRYALTIYDKKTGEGVRVSVDLNKLEKWREIKTWMLKLKNKKEQDSQALLNKILEAGTAILNYRKVRVDLTSIKREKSPVAICPVCGEGYPAADGDICLACKGEKEYCSAPESTEARLKAVTRR